MKKFEFDVPLYKHKITVAYMKSKKDKAEVLKEAKKLHMDKELLEELSKDLDYEPFDGGKIYYNKSKLKFFILIFPHSSIEELLKTIIHESRHATDDIIEACGLEGREAYAYLEEEICIQIIKELVNLKKRS